MGGIGSRQTVEVVTSNQNMKIKDGSDVSSNATANGLSSTSNGSNASSKYASNESDDGTTVKHDGSQLSKTATTRTAPATTCATGLSSTVPTAKLNELSTAV